MTAKYHRCPDGRIARCYATKRPCPFNAVSAPGTGSAATTSDSAPLIPAPVSQIVKNTEATGISFEVAFARVFGAQVNPDYERRGENATIRHIENSLRQQKALLSSLPNLVQHVAERSNPIDFISKSGQTISLKSNLRALGKQSPQKIGQASLVKHVEHFSHLYPSNILSLPKDQALRVIKKKILAHPQLFMRSYWSHAFDTDYTVIAYNIFDKSGLSDAVEFFTIRKSATPKFDGEFVFTKNSADPASDRSWKESSTVKYRSRGSSAQYLSLGEFQIHNHRDGIKFRFNLDGLRQLSQRGDLPLMIEKTQ